MVRVGLSASQLARGSNSVDQFRRFWQSRDSLQKIFAHILGAERVPNSSSLLGALRAASNQSI